MELFLLYIWLKLDVVIALCVVSSIGLGLVTLILFPYIDIEVRHDNKPQWRKKQWQLFYAFVVTLCIAVFIPSSKQTAILVGGHYALKLADTPEADKVMSVLRKKANEYLDAELSKEPK